MRSGILVINKPKNMTSREVVNQVGKILKTKKVGHTGTLDPLAEGVLVLGINQGTKIIELLTKSEKEYIAEVIMGQASDTLDITGNIKNYPLEKVYSEKEIVNVLNTFLGSYNQEVPLYSAIHVNGKRLYQYARSGQDVTLPSRIVTIQEIELIGKTQVEENKQVFKIRVVVSKGTYIRSLIRDIGIKLGCSCIMKSLLRTKQGQFSLSQATTLEKLSSQTPLLKIEEALKTISEYDTVEVTKELESKIRNGSVLPKIFNGAYAVLLNKEHELLAIYQSYAKDHSQMKPWKVFHREEQE